MDWEAADRICGNRWKTLSNLMESMEHHGRLKLHHEGRDRLFPGQCLHPGPVAEAREGDRWARRARGRRHIVGRKIPARIYDKRDRPPSGFLEIDLVSHCGRPLVGSFIHSLVATDAATAGPKRFPF